MHGNQGHTLTPSQMGSDIADIKSLGANFVRLGHYAHDRHIVGLAARYGLLVSEEPPIFRAKPARSQGSKRRKILIGKRDPPRLEQSRGWDFGSCRTKDLAQDLGYMKEMSRLRAQPG